MENGFSQVAPSSTIYFFEISDIVIDKKEIDWRIEIPKFRSGIFLWSFVCILFNYGR